MPSSNRNAYSRFIPCEEVGKVTQWRFGDVQGADPFNALQVDPVVQEQSHEPPPNWIDEEQQRALVQQTWDEAFAQGLEQGTQQGLHKGVQETTQEWQRRMDEYVGGQARQAAQRLDGVVQALDVQLAAMQQAMSEQMLHLACDIAQTVVRQALQSQPHTLLPVVQEALALLVQEGRPAVVRLHPSDIEHCAQELQALSAQGPVQWVADASIEPGGCVAECGGALVDATVAKRWQRAIAALGLQTPWDGSVDAAQHAPDLPDAHDSPDAPDAPRHTPTTP